jgi:ankyrin repeat protein
MMNLPIPEGDVLFLCPQSQQFNLKSHDNKKNLPEQYNTTALPVPLLSSVKMPRSPSPNGKKKRGKGKKKKKLSKAAKAAKKLAAKLKKENVARQKEKNLINEKELRDSAASGDIERTRQALGRFQEFEDPPGNVDTPDNFGMSAMLHAAMRGHEKIVEILIAGHSGYEHIEQFDDETGDLVINEETGEPLLTRIPKRWANSDVNFQSNGGGSTALMWACERGHSEVVRMLVKAGCAPDVRNDYGWTALHLAALNGHVDCVAELFAHEGAVLDLMNETIDFLHPNSGNSAFMWATTKSQLRCMQALLELGCDCRGPNALGMTPPEIAETAGHNEAMQLLQDWDTTCEKKRADTLEQIETYGVDYVRNLGVDIEALKECWHGCPEVTYQEVTELDEETGEQVIVMAPIIDEETGETTGEEPKMEKKGGCTCLKLLPTEEEIAVAAQEAAAADMNKKSKKRKGRGRSRTKGGTEGKRTEGKRRESPSSSSRKRK